MDGLFKSITQTDSPAVSEPDGPAPGQVFALDPGPVETAYVVYDPGGHHSTRPIIAAGIAANADVRRVLRAYPQRGSGTTTFAVEMIASYGMAVGREVFETCLWIGRFVELWDGPHRLVYRRDVKLHLCGSAKAKDPNVRQALLDRFGPGKDLAVGVKASPGPLYGLKSHLWAALAVAVYAADSSPTRVTP